MTTAQKTATRKREADAAALGIKIENQVFIRGGATGPGKMVKAPSVEEAAEKFRAGEGTIIPERTVTLRISRLRSLSAGEKALDCNEGEVADILRQGAPTLFKVGDVVLLKSGGHPMTVSDASCGLLSPLCCVWSCDSAIREEEFLPAMLRHATPAEMSRLTYDDDIPF